MKEIKRQLTITWAGENNLLPLQTINSDHSKEALNGATTTSSLLYHLGTTQLS